MKRIVGIIVFLSVIGQVYSQKKQNIEVPMLNGVSVDADLSDWPSLNKVGEDDAWLYQMGYDKDNIYFALQINDPALQNFAVRYGISVSFLGRSKKEKDQELLYPYLDRETLRALQSADIATVEDVKTELINRVRGYQVKGFRDILDGLLSFQNSYGLKALAKVDSNALLYEAVIPRKQVLSKDNVYLVKLEINDMFSSLPVHLKGRPVQSVAGRQRGAAKSKTKILNQVTIETTIQ